MRKARFHGRAILAAFTCTCVLSVFVNTPFAEPHLTALLFVSAIITMREIDLDVATAPWVMARTTMVRP